MKHMKLFFAWLLIFALAIPGLGISEAIDDADVIEDAVIEDAVIETPVIDDTELIPEIETIETVSEDIEPAGSARLNRLAAEYGIAPEKILYLAGVSAEDIELMSATEFAALRDQIENAFGDEEIIVEENDPDAWFAAHEAEIFPETMDLTDEYVAMGNMFAPADFKYTGSGTSVRWAYATCDQAYLTVGTPATFTLHLSGFTPARIVARIYKGALPHSSSISSYASATLTNGENTMTFTPDEAARYFFNFYAYDSDGNYIQAMYYGPETITDPLQARINSVLAGVTSSMSTVEKITYIHDWIVNNTDYGKESTGACYHMTGVLIDGLAVCQGYAETFRMFMEKLGIPCLTVTSRSGNHGWNKVRVGNQWLHVDCTWDDPVGGSPRHLFLLLTDDEFKNTQPYHGEWNEEGQDTELLPSTGDLFINTNPANTTAVNGSTVRFTVGANGGSGTYHYAWQYNTGSGWTDCTGTGYNTTTLTVNATSARNGYKYRCIVSDDNDSMVSNVATLTVSEATAPVITKHPINVTNALNTTANFTVTATGSSLTYQWQYRSTPTGTWTNTSIAGNTTATLSVPVTATRHGYQYRCIVRNSLGTVYSNAAMLTVTGSRPVIVTHPANQTVNTGATANFTVVANGSGLSYQWQYRTSESGAWQNTSITGNTTATLSVSAVSTRNGYQYRCAVKNSAGTVYSNAATLTIITALRITTQPVSRTLNQGATATFSVAASGTGLTYQWQRNPGSGWVNTTLNGCKTNTITFEATAARNGTKYRCIVTDVAGTSVTSNEATLTVLDAPSITTQPADRTVALNETATFSVVASGSGLTYQWQYRTSASGAWANTSITGNTTATLSVPAIASRNGYQYRCVVKNAAGATAASNAATLTILLDRPVITTHPEDATVPVSSNATFTVAATGTGLSYQWQYRTSTTGTWANTSMTGNTTATLTVPATAARNHYQYRCAVKNAAGTTYSNAATLTVITELTARLGTNSVSITAGETVKLAFTAPTAGTYSFYTTGNYDTYGYLYTTSGSTIANDDDSGTSRNFCIEHSLTAGQKIYVGVRFYSSSSSGTVDLVIEKALPIIMTHPSDQRVDEGETATFSVYTSAGDFSYQWQYRTSSTGAWNNTSLSGNKTATLSVPAIASRNGYQYRCAVSNTNGTVYSNAATLTVVTTLIARIGTNSVSVPAGETVKLLFTAPSTGTYYFYSTGSDDTYGTLYSTTGSYIASNDDSGDGSNFRLEYSMNAGDKLYVGVKYYSSSTSGTITLVIEKEGATLPVITAQPYDMSVNEGATAEFYVTATGSGLIYQWQYRTSATGSWANTSMEGNQTEKITVPATTARNGYQYRCVIKNDAGTVYSNAATLTVLADLTHVAHLGETTFWLNEQSIQVYKFTAPSAGTYLFYTTGNGDTYGYLSHISGINPSISSTYFDSNDDGDEDYNFKLEYEMTAGQVVYIGIRFFSDSASGTVTFVIEKDGLRAPVITSQPANASAAVSENASFSVVATGSGLSYQWQYRTSSTGSWANTSMSGNTTATLTVPMTTARNGYQYRCAVTNAAGTVYSDAATLFLNDGTTKYRAYVVGNEYEGTGSDLPGPHNDATSMTQFLTGLTGTPFTVTHRENRDADDILSDILSTFTGATENDVSLFYYSGHGSSSGALIGQDLYGISPASLRDTLDKVPGKKIVLLDSCYSGAHINKSVGENIAESFTSNVISAFADAPTFSSIDEVFSEKTIDKAGYFVITACSKEEQSLTVSTDGTWHGLMTYYLLEGCGYDQDSHTFTSTRPADTNSDKRLTLNEAYVYTRDNTASRQSARVYPENSSQVLFAMR